MPGEGVKVAIQCLHIGLLVDDALTAVHQYRNVVGMGGGDDVGQVGYCTEHV